MTGTFIKELMKKAFKPKTTGKTINPFERKTMRSDAAAKMGDIKVQLGKLKGGAKKLQTSVEDVRAAMRERAKGKKSFSTGKELEQQEYFNNMNKTRIKKMGGGMMGRRMAVSYTHLTLPTKRIV